MTESPLDLAWYARASMMDRILEPEVMDTVEDAEEYDALDFSEPNGRFADAAAQLLRGLRAPRVLDIGTGNAEIPLLLLQRRPDTRVVAIDMSETMLAVAARRVAESPHAGQIELIKMDGKSLETFAGSFDLVMSNSVAHHIPQPADLFREARRALRPGGALIVRDLIRPPTVDEARAMVERDTPHVSPKQQGLFYDSLLAALTLEEVREAADAAGLEGLTIQRVSDRHWSAERPPSAAAPAVSPSLRTSDGPPAG